MERREPTAQVLRDGAAPGAPAPACQAACPDLQLSEEKPGSPKPLSTDFTFQPWMVLEAKGTPSTTRLEQVSMWATPQTLSKHWHLPHNDSCHFQETPCVPGTGQGASGPTTLKHHNNLRKEGETEAQGNTLPEGHTAATGLSPELKRSTACAIASTPQLLPPTTKLQFGVTDQALSASAAGRSCCPRAESCCGRTPGARGPQQPAGQAGQDLAEVLEEQGVETGSATALPWLGRVLCCPVSAGGDKAVCSTSLLGC